MCSNRCAKPGAAGLFVRRADVIPEVHGNHRHTLVAAQDHVEAVRQRVLLECDLAGCRTTPTQTAGRVSLSDATGHASQCDDENDEDAHVGFVQHDVDVRHQHGNVGRVQPRPFLLVLIGGASRLAHRYQQATDRYGRHVSPIFVSRAGVGSARSLYALWTALTMPRSPTGSTSGRCKRNIRNISAVQRPMPFTLVNASITSSSASDVERVQTQRPVENPRAQIAHVFELLRTQADGSKLLVGTRATAAGVGPPSKSAEKRPSIVRRGLGGQLLRDDGVQQRMKRIRRAATMPGRIHRAGG